MANYITTTDGTADISDAAGTDQYLITAALAGKINVSKSFVNFTEATGSQTGTTGTLTLTVGGNVIGTMTASQGGAAGECIVFTYDGTYTTGADPWYPIAVGDDILVEVGTQATGGTVTGDGSLNLCIEWDVGA
jgi:hypothetical protein